MDAPPHVVKVTLTLTHSVQLWTGKGHKRHKATVTRVLYRTMAHTEADGKGYANVVMRFGYNPPHSVRGALTIVAHAVTGTTTRVLRLTVAYATPSKTHRVKGKAKAPTKGETKR